MDGRMDGRTVGRTVGGTAGRSDGWTVGRTVGTANLARFADRAPANFEDLGNLDGTML